MIDNDEISTYIRDVMARESKLTEWERSFVQSISEQHDRSGSLSPKQNEILERIWDRVT